MRNTTTNNLPTNPFRSRNWEANIRKVFIKPCDVDEDPLGYKAVFLFEPALAQEIRKKSFEIGASFLAQRIYNLEKAGREAPMTQQAISMVEKKIGEALAMPDLESLGRAV